MKREVFYKDKKIEYILERKKVKNIKLSSYASRCIENEILMHFRNIKKSSQDISLNETIDTDKDGNPLSLIDILSTDDNILESLNTKLNINKLYEYIK